MIIFISTIVAVFLVGCNPDTVISENITLMLPSEIERVEYTIGDDFSWDQLYFNVYDENNDFVESVYIDSTMISNNDLLKLNTPGQKSISVNYKGKTLFITFVVSSRTEIINYNVVFNANGGLFEDTSSETKTLNTSLISEIPIPFREGYTFLGWYLNSTFSGNNIISPYLITADTTLYAKWQHSQTHSIEYREIIDEENKGIIGSAINNIIHGSTVSLALPQERPKYSFVCYEVYNANNPTQLVETYLNKADNLIVNNDLIIFVKYVTRRITITYFSNAWQEQSKTIQVEYGTNSDTHYYPFPEKEGFSGSWIDRVTGQAPNYYNIISDMNIDANYSTNKYSVRFFENSSIEFFDFARLDIVHGTSLQNPPAVPSRTGHSGYWSIISTEGQTSGQFIPVDLSSLLITANTQIFAQYTKNEYNIDFNFSLLRSSDNQEKTFIIRKTFLYDTTISLQDSENLYVNRVINEEEYNGYNEKYLEVKWYSSASFEPSKLITFPFKLVANVILFAKIVDRDYQIDFIIPPQYGDFSDVSITAKKNSSISPPEYQIEGYDIVGWKHYMSYSIYSETDVYNQGDYVHYEDQYYICLQNNVMGKNPASLENDLLWDQTSGRPSHVYYLMDSSFITLDDFYLFDDDPIKDRAFYPQLTKKTYTLKFYTWEITGEIGNYTIDKSAQARGDVSNIEHGSLIRLNSYFETPPGEDYPPYPPQYPQGGQDSEYILSAWYTDVDYNGEPIYPSDDIKITSNMNFYTYWTDLLAGTEGLLYTLFEGTQQDPISYQVTGFNPVVKDYSSIDIIIPENHQGCPVVSIADNVFSSNLEGIKIQSISLPANLNSIGKSAFSGCNYLNNFELDAENDNFAIFEGILYTITLDTLISMPAQIKIDEQFVSIFSVPSTVTTILDGAFSNCSNLTTLQFEDVEIIGLTPFEGSSLTQIGDYSFAGCINLEEIVIPNSLEILGSYVFMACYKLDTIHFGQDSSLKIIGSEVLTDTPWYQDAQIDEFICLGNVLLGYNPQAEDYFISVPDNIISLADFAFDYDDFEGNNLESIIFSQNSELTFIGNYAFAGCNVLNKIYLLSQNKVELTSQSFMGINNNCELHVPNNLLTTYQADSIVSEAFPVSSGRLIGE